MLPKAEFVHWWFATGFLIIGLLLLAEAFVGEAVWRRRPWRVYLWPSFLFGMGVLMWPVMVFYTNSTIHMLAHGSWAQAMMLAGAAELGLAQLGLQSIEATDAKQSTEKHHPHHRLHRHLRPRASVAYSAQQIGEPPDLAPVTEHPREVAPARQRSFSLGGRTLPLHGALDLLLVHPPTPSGALRPLAATPHSPSFRRHAAAGRDRSVPRPTSPPPQGSVHRA